MTIYGSILQGVVAGGAAAYLRNRVHQESEERCADTWTGVALQVNHLILLMTETIHAVNVPLGLFGTFARSAYILTPFVWLANRGEPITEIQANYAQQFNQIYTLGVVASSVAAFVLGSPVFAISSLAMLAVDRVVKDQSETAFAQVRKITALFAFVGYSSQVFAGSSFVATLAQISTVVMTVKLLVIDFLSDPSVPEDNRATEARNLSQERTVSSISNFLSGVGKGVSSFMNGSSSGFEPSYTRPFYSNYGYPSQPSVVVVNNNNSNNHWVRFQSKPSFSSNSAVPTATRSASKPSDSTSTWVTSPVRNGAFFEEDSKKTQSASAPVRNTGLW